MGWDTMRYGAIAVFLLLSSAAVAQDALPPTAAANLDRGVGLARQGQWSLALKYFRAAHEEAPDNPATLLNLGLVNDRMGGREAAAIAWFRAYLAAAGGAANAAQVRSRVGELDTALEIKVQKILDVATQVAAELPDAAERVPVISWVMRAAAESDDIGAVARVQKHLPVGTRAGWGVAHVATAHGRKGNLAAAMEHVNFLGGSPLMQSWALAEIAVEQAKRRDFDGAAQTAAGIKVRREAAFAYSRIAVLRARAGDAAGAEATAARIEADDAGAKAIAQAAVATALARAGDRAGASSALAEAAELQSRIDGFADRMNARAMIAVARAAVSPDLAAMAAVEGLSDGAHRDRALRDIAALRGDLARAETYHWSSVAHEMEDNVHLGDMQGAIDAAKAKAPGQSVVAIATVGYEGARAMAKLRE